MARRRDSSRCCAICCAIDQRPGWWTGRRDHDGAWEGPQARAYFDGIQAAALDFWRRRA